MLWVIMTSLNHWYFPSSIQPHFMGRTMCETLNCIKSLKRLKVQLETHGSWQLKPGHRNVNIISHRPKPINLYIMCPCKHAQVSPCLRLSHQPNGLTANHSWVNNYSAFAKQWTRLWVRTVSQCTCVFYSLHGSQMASRTNQFHLLNVNLTLI